MDIHAYSNQDWESLLQQAAHDVRNPLATLSAYSELTLRKSERTDAEQTLAREGQRSVLYTSIFLDLLSLRAKRYTLSLSVVPIDSLITSTQYLATMLGLPVKTQTQDIDGILMQADPQAFSTACIALALSRDHSPDPLTLHFLRKGKQLFVDMKDRPLEKDTFLRVYANAVFVLHQGSILAQSPEKFTVRFPL